MNRPGPARGKTKIAPDAVETSPVVVLSRVFPARPSSFPDAETFVRESLTDAPITNESRVQVTEAVLDALLGAAGPEGASIHVALRIYPDRVEVDVLRTATESDELVLSDEIEPSFAKWMGGILTRRGLSQEAGARELGVSVRTMSRWIAGDTEPRLRDLRRIRDVFGEIPLN
jgi:hypothetical protein